MIDVILLDFRGNQLNIGHRLPGCIRLLVRLFSIDSRQEISEYHRQTKAEIADKAFKLREIGYYGFSLYLLARQI
jgi:hypothetical protein